MRWGLPIATLILAPALAAAAGAGVAPDAAPAASVPAVPPAGPLLASPSSPAAVAGDLAGQTPREIDFRGNTQLSSATLRRLMATRAGRPIDAAALERDLNVVEQAYHDRGFTLMRALSPEPLTADGVLVLPIQEGRVEAIEVVGNKKTRRWVILRQMETRPGSVYNEHTVRDDRQRLNNLGIFRDVQVGSAGGAALGQAVVSVKVIEARSAELATTLGYSSKTGLLGYFYGEEDNLAGTARQVNARWERFAVTRGSAYQGGFFTPWSPLPKTSLRITGYRTSPFRFVYSTGDIDEQNIRSYEVRSGGAVQLARELTVRNQLLFGFRNDDVHYDQLPLNVRIPAGYSTEIGTLRVFSLGLANDTRDLPFNPRRGGVHTFNVEFGQESSGGGSYTRYTANLRRYFRAGGARVLANRVLLGTSSGKVPLPELFWLGGPDSLRGYDRDRFYGRSMVSGTTELRVPVGTGLQAVGFVDAGRASGSGGLKAAVGVGLRVITPIGPLRIDFAVGSEGARTHFTAGYVAF